MLRLLDDPPETMFVRVTTRDVTRRPIRPIGELAAAGTRRETCASVVWFARDVTVSCVDNLSWKVEKALKA